MDTNLHYKRKYLFIILVAFSLLGCSIADLFSEQEDDNRPGADVWVSEDGIHWEQVTENAAFGVRTRPLTLAFSDKLWIIGGANLEYALLEPIQYFDDVWNSDDGINWQKIRENSDTGNTACVECPLNMKGRHLAYSFLDRIWLYGIPADHSEYHSFYSSDGLNWVKQDSISQKGFLLAHTFFKDRLWAVSEPGFEGAAGENRVWFSEDGIQWHQAPQKPEFSPLYGYSITVFKNELWLLGRDKNETWHSADGIKWQIAADSLNIGPLEHVDYIAFNHKLWIFTPPGYDYEKNEYISNIIWQSDDGILWTKVQSTPEFGPRRGHAIVDFKEKLWIIGGLERY